MTGAVLGCLSLLSVGTLWAFTVSLLTGACLFDHERYGLAAPALLLSGPYALLLWKVIRKHQTAASLASGIAGGVGVGSAVFWVRYANYPVGAPLEVPLWLFVATHLALASAGVVIGWGTLVRRWWLVSAVFCIGVITFGQGIPDDDAKRGNALAAVGALRRINAALREYVVSYRVGFPSSLHSQWPAEHVNCESAALLKERRVGQAVPGYTILYTPGAPLPGASQPCGPSAASYTLIARPVYGRTACHGFFTDESGVIRYTRTPSAPTIGDSQW